MTYFRASLAVLAIVLITSNAKLNADVIVLSAIADTTLHQGAPDANMGAHDRLMSGLDGLGDFRRALLRFDIAGMVPAGATINSASLTLVVPDGNIASPSNFLLHRALFDWGEGTGVGMFGQPANNGEATWNQRMHNVAAWNAPGGQAGVDYVAGASSSTLVSGFGTYTWTGLAGDVQLWLDNPGSDFGWFLISDSATLQSARRFGSREAAGFAPLLTIDFTPIPEPTTTTFALLSLLGLACLRRKR